MRLVLMSATLRLRLSCYDGITCFKITRNLNTETSYRRFGQRCGEAKVTFHANSEVSMADQIKDLLAHVKQLERQVSLLEEEKVSISLELNKSKEYWRQVWEPRTLTSQEKINCKLCVQNLFASAKESLALQNSSSAHLEESTSPRSLPSSPSSRHGAPQGDFEHRVSLTSEVDNKTALGVSECVLPVAVCCDTESVIERSREDLYLSVEKMDRAVLIELSIALGGLVQTMYLEREKAKAEELKRVARKTKIIAEKEARLKAKLDVEEEEKVTDSLISLTSSHCICIYMHSSVWTFVTCGLGVLDLFHHSALRCAINGLTAM